MTLHMFILSRDLHLASGSEHLKKLLHMGVPLPVPMQCYNQSYFVVSVQKVLLDQLVFSPFFLGVFFTYNGVMEGHNLEGIKAKFDSVLRPCMSH